MRKQFMKIEHCLLPGIPYNFPYKVLTRETCCKKYDPF